MFTSDSVVSSNIEIFSLLMNGHENPSSIVPSKVKRRLIIQNYIYYNLASKSVATRLGEPLGLHVHGLTY